MSPEHPDLKSQGPTAPAHTGLSDLRIGARYPKGWEISTPDVETVLLRLPPEVTRVTASMRLAIEAEFGGWELSRVRLYSDGSRKVLLRRKRPNRRRGEPPSSARVAS